MPSDIFREIVKIKKRGGRVALCTIISARGSTPRDMSAKMLVGEDGALFGSIGGGRVEAKVISRAKEALRSGKARKEVFKMDNKENSPGPICGGNMEIYIEPIEPPHCAVIFGGGHVGSETARLAHIVGFEVVVADDRRKFANPKKFPFAKAVYSGNYGNMLSKNKIPVTPYSYIVIVTRGHAHDKTVLRWALGTSARYIGMIGSKRKVKETADALAKEGFEKKQFLRINAPIGLDIGAETPSEIALSIVAQMVETRRRGKTISRQKR